MMHRNIEQALKHSSGEKFSVKDKVQIRNPKMPVKGRIASRDPFAPLNVVGEVLEVLPGSMYRVKLPDGEDHFQKAFFEEEKILFERHTDSDCPTDKAMSNSKKNLLNAVTDFSFQIRRKFYKNSK